MLSFRVTLSTVALIASLAFAPSLPGKTATDIACETLPAKVAAAAAKYKAKPETERECEKIDDGGKTFYEVKITGTNGKMRELVFHADGRLYEEEEETDASMVPAAARQAIEKAASGGTLVKYDLIRRGGISLYEGEYREGGAKKKVIVDAAGKVVGP